MKIKQNKKEKKTQPSKSKQSKAKRTAVVCPESRAVCTDWADLHLHFLSGTKAMRPKTQGSAMSTNKQHLHQNFYDSFLTKTGATPD